MNMGEAVRIGADGLCTAVGRHEPVIPVALSLLEWRGRHAAQPRRGRQHGDALDAVGPPDRERLGDVGAPIVPDDRQLLDPERIQQRDHVHRMDAGVAGPWRLRVAEACIAEPAQCRDDHPEPRFADHRRHLVPRGSIIRPAMQKHHWLGGMRVHFLDVDGEIRRIDHRHRRNSESQSLDEPVGPRLDRLSRFNAGVRPSCDAPPPGGRPGRCARSRLAACCASQRRRRPRPSSSL